MPARIITYFFLLLAAAVYHTSAQCVWGDCHLDNIPQCDQGDVSVTSGYGECPGDTHCPPGFHRDLCCPPGIFQECQWLGTPPDCDLNCPRGTVEVARDIRGDGDTSCQSGCRVYCCDQANGNGTALATAAAMCSAVATGKTSHLFVSQPFGKMQ